MKKFIFKTSLFCFIISGIILIGEVAVRGVDNSYQYKDHYVKTHGARIENIILGTSHAYNAVSPRFMSNATFNLAIPAQPLVYDYYILENYRSYLPNLKRVILDVGYLSLALDDFDNLEGDSYKVMYNLYMDFPQLSSDYSLRLMCFVWPRYTEILRMVANGNNPGVCDSLGWGSAGSIANKTATWENAINDIKRHTKTGDYEKKLRKNQQYLAKLAKYCNNEKIELILISTPIWHTYRELYNLDQLNDMYTTVEQLQNQYDLNFYDFSNDPRFVADDFFNTSHLSDIGAEKFTHILVDTLGLSQE